MAKKDKAINPKEKSDQNAGTTSQKTDKLVTASEAEVKGSVVSSLSTKGFLVDEKVYNKELRRLHVELVKLQEWVRCQRAEDGRDF